MAYFGPSLIPQLSVLGIVVVSQVEKVMSHARLIVSRCAVQRTETDAHVVRCGAHGLAEGQRTCE